MTRRFLDVRRDEAWAVILPEHVDHPGFRDGFDLPAFAQAFTAITGRPFPHVEPAPGPPPFTSRSRWPLGWLAWLWRVLRGRG